MSTSLEDQRFAQASAPSAAQAQTINDHRADNAAIESPF
jgi:hypothetical protein